MPITNSTNLTLARIAETFGGSPPYTLTDYYRGGAYVEDTPANARIPASGEISYADFVLPGTPPTWVLLAGTFLALVDDALSFQLPAATGGDGDGTFTYSVTDLPEQLSFDPATRTVTGTFTAPDSFAFTYTAEASNFFMVDQTIDVVAFYDTLAVVEYFIETELPVDQFLSIAQSGAGVLTTSPPVLDLTGSAMIQVSGGVPPLTLTMPGFDYLLVDGGAAASPFTITDAAGATVTGNWGRALVSLPSFTGPRLVAYDTVVAT